MGILSSVLRDGEFTRELIQSFLSRGAALHVDAGLIEQRLRALSGANPAQLADLYLGWRRAGREGIDAALDRSDAGHLFDPRLSAPTPPSGGPGAEPSVRLVSDIERGYRR